MLRKLQKGGRKKKPDFVQEDWRVFKDTNPINANINNELRSVSALMCLINFAMKPHLIIHIINTFIGTSRPPTFLCI